jgi:hypothetical protein
VPLNPSSAQQRDLTVANVRDRPGTGFVEVMFLESARIFRVSRSHERFGELLSKLQKAADGRRALRVSFAAANGGEIDDVWEL